MFGCVAVKVSKSPRLAIFSDRLIHAELVFDSEEPARLVLTRSEKGAEGERAQIGLIDGTSVLNGKDFFRLGLF